MEHMQKMHENMGGMMGGKGMMMKDGMGEKQSDDTVDHEKHHPAK